MIAVKKLGILLEKTEFEFENEGVLNPAVIKEGNNVHIFYRALKKGNYSSIGYCRLDGPLKIIERNQKPIIYSQYDYESHGVEDPRITKIENTYYLTYTAFDGNNALSALATSTNLKDFQKLGLITPQMNFEKFKCLLEYCETKTEEKYTRFYEFLKIEMSGNSFNLWDKDVVFFPRKINKKFVFLQRIRPGIQMVSFNSIEDLTQIFWDNYFKNFSEYIVLEPKFNHEASYIGAGCPPIETKDGWILIYHGVESTADGRVYHACAALLDLEDPSKEISRLKYPLFSPELSYEKKGVVNNVVFPTGTALFDDQLHIYYGAGDEQIAVASVNFNTLLDELKKTN